MMGGGFYVPKRRYAIDDIKKGRKEEEEAHLVSQRDWITKDTIQRCPVWTGVTVREQYYG